MKKILSLVLVAVALFGLVASGLSIKDVLTSKDYYSKKGEETDANFAALDEGIAQLEENEAAYLAGKSQYEGGLQQYEAGKESLEQAKSLVSALEQLQGGFADWQKGFDGLTTLAGQAGLPAPAADNVDIYDAAIEQANVEALKDVPQAVADVKVQLANALSSIAGGVLADPDMSAALEQATGSSADQISAMVAALPDMPYDQFELAVGSFMAPIGALVENVKPQIEAGEAALADAEEQLADGKAQLDAYEQGCAVLTDGLDQVIAAEDKGLESVKERLGDGFSYMKNETDLDFDACKKVVEAGRAFSKDSGDLITKEVVTRVIAIALVLLGSLAALGAGLLGLRGKLKLNKLLSVLALVLGGAGFIMLLIAGTYYSKPAGGASAAVLILVAGGLLAVSGLANFAVGKEEKKPEAKA